VKLKLIFFIISMNFSLEMVKGLNTWYYASSFTRHWELYLWVQVNN